MRAVTARFAVSYLPIFVARIGSGASAILVVRLAGGHSDVAAAAVLSAYPFLEAAGAFLAGRWSDLVGRKSTLVAGYVVRSAAMLLLALAFFLRAGPLVEAVLNGVVGFTTAFILVASLAMATDLTEVRNRGVGMGGFELVNFGSYGVGYLLGAALYQALRGPAAYLAVALLTLAATPLFAALLRETRPAAAAVPRLLWASLPPTAVALLPIWFALTTIIGIGIYAPRVLRLETHGAGGAVVSRLGESLTVGLLFTGALAVLGLGALFFGRLTDRWSRLKVFRLGMAGGLAALLAMNVALYAGLDPVTAVALAAPLLFTASAIGPSILALIGDTAGLGERGTAMGIYSVVLGVGMGMGNLLAGAASQLASNELLGLALAGLLVFASMSALHLALWSRLQARGHPEAGALSVGT